MNSMGSECADRPVSRHYARIEDAIGIDCQLSVTAATAKRAIRCILVFYAASAYFAHVIDSNVGNAESLQEFARFLHEVAIRSHSNDACTHWYSGCYCASDHLNGAAKASWPLRDRIVEFWMGCVERCG